VGNPVMPMPGVPPKVTVEPVAHVDQFFGDDDFERHWLGPVNARQVDQHGVFARTGQKGVGAAKGSRHPSPPEPASEGGTVGGDTQAIRRQKQPIDVSQEQVNCLLILNIKQHPRRSPYHGPSVGVARTNHTTGGPIGLPVGANCGMGTSANPIPAGVRPHVLVVSDDAGLAEFLAEGLTVAGLWVSVVASPFQALEVFRLRSFDAVIVDAALGGFGALELTRRLRARPEADASPPSRTDVPLILVAGAGDELDPAAGATAGADAVVVAPLMADELAATILTLLTAWRSEHPNRPWADQAILSAKDRRDDGREP
jgi:CheY-like chemotaxis protein